MTCTTKLPTKPVCFVAISLSKDYTVFSQPMNHVVLVNLHSLDQYPSNPITSTGPHLTCVLVWRKGNINKKLSLCCTVVKVHKATRSFYRSVDCIGL